MKILNRQEIVAAKDIQTREVPIPEWGEGVGVVVRMMTGADRNLFEKSIVAIDAEGKRSPNMDNIRLKLVAMTMVDPDGNPLFGPDELGDLAKKSAAAIDRIFAVAQELNGMAPASVEDAEKNSAPGLNGSSVSASLSH